MRKQAAPNVFLDRLHKGSVWVCIGLTAFTGLILAKRGYDYFTQVKPEREQIKQIIQQELLAEGASDKAILRDTAPQLKS